MLGDVVRDIWMWAGITLVLVFFIATRLIESSRFGPVILDGPDRLTDPLWQWLDDYIRAIIGALFVSSPSSRSAKAPDSDIGAPTRGQQPVK